MFMFEGGFPEWRGQILHAVGLFVLAIERFDLFCTRSSSVCRAIFILHRGTNIDAKHQRRMSPKRPKVCKCGVT